MTDGRSGSVPPTVPALAIARRKSQKEAAVAAYGRLYEPAALPPVALGVKREPE
jgi:hypothetical protein